MIEINKAEHCQRSQLGQSGFTGKSRRFDHSKSLDGPGFSSNIMCMLSSVEHL